MDVVYLIRHGQASFGAADYDALSETGARQCKILGAFLLSSGIFFDSVFTGSMLRQIDTARIVMDNAPDCFRGINPVASPDFDEHESGAIIKSQLPGIIEEEPDLADDVKIFFRDKHAFDRLFTRSMSRWVSGAHDVPGVETFSDFNNRVRNCFHNTIIKNSRGNSRGTKSALFTSGGVIASIVQEALSIPDEKATRLPWWTRNASVTVVRRSKSNLDLLCFNSTAHLEAMNDPALLTYK